MKIFNTLSRQKEEFVPLEEGKVSMYVCGPTVYNLIHIGNARPMIVFDTVRRYMEHKGYAVNYVSNFTDVDDKIIRKANEENVDPAVISERYIEECKKDMKGLNVKPATVHPKATEEIDGMIDMIQTLIDKDPGMVQYISRQGVSGSTGSFLTRIWMIFEAAIAHCWYPVKSRNRTRWISYCGSLKKKENLTGSLPGVKDVRAGILNVLL